MNSITHIAVRDTADDTSHGFSTPHATLASQGEAVSKGTLIRRRITEHVQSLPTARDAAFDLARIIDAENREARVLRNNEITLSDDGTWCAGGDKLRISRDAFTSLMAKVGGAGAASYLSGVDPDLRAYNVRALLAKNPNDLRKYAVRDGRDGQREIYAIMGENYPLVGAKETLDQIARRAPTDSRAEWRYDPNSTRVEFKELMRSEVTPTLKQWDDVFQIGRAWSLKDNGAAAIKVALLTFRMACSNMLIWREDNSYAVRVLHRGAASSVAERLLDGFNEVGDLLRSFTYRWAGVRDIRALESPTMDHAIRTFEHLIDTKRLPVSKKHAPVAVAGLSVAWTAEPGDSAADVINSVTRYARDLVTSPTEHFAADELEAAAGGLMQLTPSQWDAIRAKSA
jgi:hypothetical protein